MRSDEMVWAEGRETTKGEDKAYSLGVLQVRMNTICGVDGGVLEELQHGIIAKYADQNLSRAWRGRSGKQFCGAVSTRRHHRPQKSLSRTPSLPHRHPKLVDHAKEAGGIYLALLCMVWSKVTVAVENNCRLSHDYIFGGKVPMMLVVTGLGGTKWMEDW